MSKSTLVMLTKQELADLRASTILMLTPGNMLSAKPDQCTQLRDLVKRIDKEMNKRTW